MRSDKKEYRVTLFKKYAIEKSNIMEIDNITNKTLKDCSVDFFPSFKNTKYIYDTNFTNIRKKII